MKGYTFDQLRSVAFQMKEVADYLHDDGMLPDEVTDREIEAARVLREHAEQIAEFLREIDSLSRR